MTTSEGSEGPSELPTGRNHAKSLWEQPSFLVALGLCVIWLLAFTSSSEKLQAGRGGAVLLVILTVLGYAGYRRARGLKMLLTSGWLPSRYTSQRRWIGLGVYISLLVLLLFSSATEPQAVPEGPADAPWTKTMAATTCGDWRSVMTDGQRQTFAAALLTYDLSKPHGPALDQAKANDYLSMLTDTCRNDSPSSLVIQ